MRDGTDDLLGLYVDEASEYVDVLNSSIVVLERGEGDLLATIADAFRAAHSLKGMSAALGCTATTRVTHAMEALLDLVRDAATRGDTVLADGQVIALMLEASDHIGALVTAVGETGSEPKGSDEAVVPVTSRIEAAAVRLAGQEGTTHAPLPVNVAVTEPVVEVVVTIAESALMPAVRAFAVLMALEDVGEVVGSEPSRSALEDGVFEGRTFRVQMRAEGLPSSDELRALASIREVAEVEVIAATHSSPISSASLGGADARARRTVRVDARRLDDLMHGVGELLVRRSKLQLLVGQLGDDALADAVDSLDRAARELQDLVMDVRMVSIDQLLQRIPRVVRDVAAELGKTVRLTISGRDTELDRTVMDVIGDPLMHLVRNAIDHGIEDPDERARLGKPAEGLLAISATTEGGSVAIRVRDDGGGMRPDRIRDAAVRRGVVSADRAAGLSDEEALNLCFEPGFSTRIETTRVSGRGVGLDVVRSSVRELGGDVAVESSDEGTVMTVRLPLTLAIRSTLQIRLDDEIYAFHTDRVGQTLDLERVDMQTVGGVPAIIHHGTVVPLLDLRLRLHGVSTDLSSARRAVLIEGADGQTFAVVVDAVLGQSEVVTRPLPGSVGASGLLGASAVLGDGSIAFVIDAVQLTTTTGRRHGTLAPQSVHPVPETRIQDAA